MGVYQSSLFKRQFKKLPENVQRIARNRVDLFTENQHNPRLRAHKLGGHLTGYSAFSVTHSIRIIFEQKGDDVLLHQIGDHDIYD